MTKSHLFLTIFLVIFAYTYSVFLQQILKPSLQMAKLQPYIYAKGVKVCLTINLKSFQNPTTFPHVIHTEKTQKTKDNFT
jgi:hypothetical protein